MSYILLTSGKDARNRRYNILNSSDDVAAMLMAFFEAHLNQQEEQRTGKPVEDAHEYTSDMLHQFFDEYLSELCCLVRQEDDPDLWIPYPKDWIKENCIFMYVRKLHDRQARREPAQSLYTTNNNAMEVD